MNEKFQALLRAHGHSITAARLALFEYLQQGPITPKQFIADNMNVADRASLYRTLHIFKNLGIVEERIGGGKRVIELSDAFDSHHHHLTCSTCGTSIAITDPEIEEQLSAVGRHHGFAITHHVVELTGICNRCQVTT